MPRGLPRSYLKQAQRELGPGASWRALFKRAWAIYKGTKLPKILRRKKSMSPRIRRRRYLSPAYRPRRRRSPFRRLRWRRRPKKIPILPVAGFGAGLIFGAAPGRGSVYDCIKFGDMESAARNAIYNITGIDTFDGYKFDWMKTVNPFDFTTATALKGLMWGSVASMVFGALGINRKFTEATSKIPILKRFRL